MKWLLWFALVLVVLVGWNEAAYINKSHLAWVLIGLAASQGCLAIFLLTCRKDNE